MDDDAETVHVIRAVDKGSDKGRQLPTCQEVVAEHLMPALIDTGASINLMDTEACHNLTNPLPLTPTKVRVYAFGNAQPLQMAGVFTTDLAHEGTRIKAKVYVSQERSEFLLSCQTAQDLGLLHFVFSIHASGLGDLTRKFEVLFSSIGCLKGSPLKLYIDKSVSSVTLRYRQVAFHLRPKVERELLLLEQAGIIERVSRPTPLGIPDCHSEEAQAARGRPIRPSSGRSI
ncbi:hypothetical protein NDU88_005855 [Pleurodeles waltl]|uniref:Peptidase A2 domain-containing protein n=1 Tax=Pleurodeles waltl TaxID=8319 RepID=A0AAV7PNX0_PLEWA|nr:hypothetical protein NDU88_005855 [Pleurodeles waltl]